MESASSSTLSRTYDLIVFDWDGTAVPDRMAPRTELVAALKEVLISGATCVVITGTKIENVLDENFHSLPANAKRRLYFCTNRGSEVYSFDNSGRIVVRFKRVATHDENLSLDQVAERIKRNIESHGIEAKIISNRLNRRKINLIPTDRWADPKKSEFGELFIDVQQRLHNAGIKEGIAGLMAKAFEYSRDLGALSSKITSDIKHIEIGLTDKADSIHWISEHIVRPKEIPHERIIFVGDEYGSVGGIIGSDALMRVGELTGATFMSVGVEPEGVPEWVVHVGGGPGRFVQFLRDQAKLRLADVARVIEIRASENDPTWVLVQEGFDPSREREMETLFAIGNGRLGVRGASDFPVPAAQPDLLIAGVYDKKAENLPYSELKLLSKTGREGTETEIVPFPSPFHWLLEVDGVRFRSDSPEMIDHGRTLEFKSGTYREMYRFEDQQGRRTRITTSRIASMSESGLLIQRIEILAENYSAKIKLGFPMRTREFEGLYPHLVVEEENNTEGILVYRTHASNVRVTFAQKIIMSGETGSITEKTADVNPGETIPIVRFISVSTSREASDPRTKATDGLVKCTENSLVSEIRDHSMKWAEFWNRADLKLEGAPALSQAKRFSLYHLRISADHDPRVSVPAKGLTGRAYEGHVFWDTEIFMFPFYLYTEPEIARCFLLYRYQTLNGARARAAEMGCKGACYAWESTLSGKDVTPKSILIADTKTQVPVHTGFQQIHVTADVAYAVWRYWDATLDQDFILNYGAEILLETARFWVSRVKMRGQLFHIEGVVGPDEYHFDVHDNWFTNWMARFNLEKAAYAWDWMKQNHPDRFKELAKQLALGNEELSSWAETGAHIYMPKADSQGRIEQFRGFFDLKRVEVPEYERNRPPISRLLHWDEINRAQLVKQADVLMVPFLFPDACSLETIKANYHYYEPITDHGSSLSPCVHAAVAARAGLKGEALKYWESSLFIDLLNSMANAELGIHAATIGGTWQAFVFHMLGITFGPRGIQYSTTSQLVLPKGCKEVKMKLTYRGKVYPIEIGRKRRIAA